MSFLSANDMTLGNGVIGELPLGVATEMRGEIFCELVGPLPVLREREHKQFSLPAPGRVDRRIRGGLFIDARDCTGATDVIACNTCGHTFKRHGGRLGRSDAIAPRRTGGRQCSRRCCQHFGGGVFAEKIRNTRTGAITGTQIASDLPDCALLVVDDNRTI